MFHKKTILHQFLRDHFSCLSSVSQVVGTTEKKNEDDMPKTICRSLLGIFKETLFCEAKKEAFEQM
jgi:hypothetical protein